MAWSFIVFLALQGAADPITEHTMQVRQQQGLTQLHNDAMRDANRAFGPTQKDFQRIQGFNNQQLQTMANQARLGGINVQPVPHHHHPTRQPATAPEPTNEPHSAAWPVAGLAVTGLVGGWLWRSRKPARKKPAARTAKPSKK